MVTTLLFFVILVLSMNKLSMQVALGMMSCVIKISFSYKYDIFITNVTWKSQHFP